MKLPGVLSSLFIIPALTAAVYPQQQPATKQDVITATRTAYYSLARKGFKGFAATIEPNWEVILAQTATPANLKVFRAVQFSMVVDENGAVTVTHEAGANAPSAEVVNRIHYDVQRLVTGFFNTWRIFMVASPLRETENQIKIENQGKEYRLSYTTQSGQVTIAMTDELLIKETTFSGATLKRTVKPQFQTTADGFLLTDYKQTTEPVGNGIKTTLEFHIQYQDLNGLKVPQKVRLTGMHGSEPVEAELTFLLKS